MGSNPLNANYDGRWLRRNKGTGHPTNIMCVSAVPWENQSHAKKTASTLHLRAGHIKTFRLESGNRSRLQEHRVLSHGELWQIIEGRVQKKKPLWVFAYDLPQVFTMFGGWNYWRQGVFGIQPCEVDYLPGCEPKDPDKKRPGFACDNDPPVIFAVFHRAGGKIIFCDVRNYYNLSFEQVSEGVGKPFSSWNPLTATQHTAQVEAARQCSVVCDAMCGLIKRHADDDLGNWGHTSAAIGWNAYRHRFMLGGICMHGLEVVDDLERDSYYGGMTEARRIGRISGGVSQLDVNALYPAVMANHSFPCELELSSELGHKHEGDIWRNPLDYIADVRIDSNADTYPKRSPGMGTIHCNGRFTTTLAGPELKRASDAGHIHSHGRWAKYRRTNLFGRHVRHFWSARMAARQSGDFLGDVLAKSCSNSLYGRFARRGDYWEPLTDHVCWNPNWKILSPAEQVAWLMMTGHDLGKQIALAGPSFGLDRMIRQIGRHWQVRAERKAHPNAFPAIAAYVTAWGREAMRMLIRQVGERNVWRIATDSITVNSIGRRNAESAGLINRNQIGHLKVEYEADTGRFWSVHHWQIGDHVCHGSIMPGAEIQPDGSYVERQVQRLASLIREGYKRSIKVTTVRKRPPSPDIRGGVDPDGRIKPITLREF